MSVSVERVSVLRIFQALSDPTRLQIVRKLRQGERCVCELTDALDAAQSRLSFHLKVLKDAGLVSDRREGRWIYYELRREALENLSTAIADLEPSYTPGKGRTCC